MTPNLKHIQAFVAVADLGTFRRAAERLNTTQPNISGRIAQLEEQLGFRLMERDAGSVRLTPRGLSLLAPARAILAANEAFVAAADDDTLYSGVLRLGVSELVAHTWLQPFLIEMRARFPNIDVELTVDLSANLSKALAAHDLDLTFQSGPFDRKTRFSAQLGQAPYAWVASPALDLPSGKVSADDLAHHPILAHPRGTVPYRQLDEHFRSLGAKVRIVPATNNAVCLQMTLDGLGIACLPRPMIEEHLGAGRLREVDYGWRPDALFFEARCDLDPLPPYIAEAAKIAQRLSPPKDRKS